VRAARHPWIVVALFAVLYGIQTTAYPQFRIVAMAPFTMNLPPDEQFNYGSPFTFFLGSYYLHHGLDDGWAFTTVNAIGLAFFAVSLWAYVSRRYGAATRGQALLVALMSPVLFGVLSGVGKSDPFLIAFFLLSTLAESAVTRDILCGAAVLCHQTLAPALLAAALCFDSSRWRSTLAGVAIGEGLVWIYVHELLSAVPVSRGEYAVEHLRDLGTLLWQHPLLHLWATFGPFWIVVLAHRRLTWPRIVVFAGALALAAVSFDFTRIFIIVALPLVLDISRDVVTSGVRLASLWPLMFFQLQCAANRVLLAQGFRIRL